MRESVTPDSSSPTSAESEVFMPPNPLRLKAPPRFGTADRMIASVETAVNEMQREYEQWLAEDIANLRRLLLELQSGGAAGSAARQSLARSTHDIKGQGSTFGYPLATRIAASLHGYLVGLPVEQQKTSVISAHVEALGAVGAYRLKGEGGPAGAAILATLNAALRPSADGAPSRP